MSAAAPPPATEGLQAQIEEILLAHRFAVLRDAEPIQDDKPWRMTRAVWGCTCGWEGPDSDDLAADQVPGDIVRRHKSEMLAATLAAAASVPHEQAAEVCCAEHDDCDKPGEMVCCDKCPDMARCGKCDHGCHLHDYEAVPVLCMVPECACSTPDPLSSQPGEGLRAAMQRVVDDEVANLADDGARLSHSVVRRMEAVLAAGRADADREAGR